MILGCPECDRISCICQILAEHQEACKFRVAAISAVAIECDHGYDVCPECDPCNCEDES